MSDYSPGEWAHICRTQAAWATNPATKALLLELAREYDTADLREERIMRRSAARLTFDP